MTSVTYSRCRALSSCACPSFFRHFISCPLNKFFVCLFGIAIDFTCLVLIHHCNLHVIIPSTLHRKTSVSHSSVSDDVRLIISLSLFFLLNSLWFAISWHGTDRMSAKKVECSEGEPTSSKRQTAATASIFGWWGYYSFYRATIHSSQMGHDRWWQLEITATLVFERICRPRLVDDEPQRSVMKFRAMSIRQSNLSKEKVWVRRGNKR